MHRSPQGMRTIVTSLIASVPAMGNVLLFCIFIFYVFGVLGVNVWAGALNGKCMDNSTGAGFAVIADDDGWLCAKNDANTQMMVATGGRGCPAVTTIGNISYPVSCMAETSYCSGNPNYGFTHFDNIGNAMMTIFTSITLEGWVDVMYNLMDGWGTPWFVITYFILLVLIGSFFMLNLALAVVFDEYAKADEAKKEEEMQQREYSFRPRPIILALLTGPSTCPLIISGILPLHLTTFPTKQSKTSLPAVSIRQQPSWPQWKSRRRKTA